MRECVCLLTVNWLNWKYSPTPRGYGSERRKTGAMRGETGGRDCRYLPAWFRPSVSRLSAFQAHRLPLIENKRVGDMKKPRRLVYTTPAI